MRLDPGKAKSEPQKPKNKDTSTFSTAINGKDEKTSNAKSEGSPKTFPQSTTTTQELKNDEVKNSMFKDKVKNDKLKNSTAIEFREERLSPVAETPVTAYYVRKKSS